MPAPRACPTCAVTNPRLVLTVEAGRERYANAVHGFRLACRCCAERGPLRATEAEAERAWNRHVEHALRALLASAA